MTKFHLDSGVCRCDNRVHKFKNSACLLPPTLPRLNLHWHALPWEGESCLQPAQSSSLSATVILFLTEHRLYHDSFAAASRLVHHGRFSERYLQLHVGALGVSLIHSVLSHTSLTGNFYRSAITTPFATKNGGLLSMSTGYDDLQRSP